MKTKSICMLAMAFCLGAGSGSALERNTKLGKPTTEEMQMTQYDADPEAAAVVLYSETEARFEFRQTMGDFQLVYYHKDRIKVLKPEGVEAGNVSIDLYDPESTKDYEEYIRNLKVTTYNLEDGKVTRSKMGNDLQTLERIDNNNCQVKFAAPNVKVGSVIEYEYALYSGYFFSPNTWYAQGPYPVFYTQYKIQVPDWFNFQCYPGGIFQLQSERNEDSFTIGVGAESLSTRAFQYVFTGKELPAIKDDEWVFCEKEYTTRVEHELKSINLPGSFSHNYNQTWLGLAKSLYTDSDFGARFKMQNPLAEEQKALGLTDDMPVEERVARLRELLMSQYKWNGSYSIWGASARKIRNDKDRELNLGSFDFVMMAMLRDAGIKAFPVVMSRRSKGRLPLYPSSRYFNAMVLQIETSDSTYTYLDPTAEGYAVGTLPPDMMVSKGLLVGDKGAKMLDLSKVAKGQQAYAIQASISEDGNTMTCSADLVSRQEDAGWLRGRFRAAKDSVEFAQKRTSVDGLAFSSYSIEEARSNSEQVMERYAFSEELQNTGDHIYLNPFPLLTLASPFTAETRLLPVEWSYPTSLSYYISINLPEGYEIEEAPKSKMLKFDDDMFVRVKYFVQPQNIQIRLNLTRQSTIVLAEKYPDLRSYYADMEALTQEMIVLRKK